MSRLAVWVSGLRFVDVPGEVVERTKSVIVDQLGVQVLGGRLPTVQPVLVVAERQAGTPEATITGSDVKSTVSRAAWANAILGRVCEYDDAHAKAWHTSCVVVPAAVALAERQDASGRDVITAVAAGIQVMALLGAAADAEAGAATGAGLTGRAWPGWRTLAAFGAAAAAGVILGLSSAEMVNAFAIATGGADVAAELDCGAGAITCLHAGSAARCGLEAAMLARLGLTMPNAGLDSGTGAAGLFSVAPSREVVDTVWHHWHVLDTIFRFYPVVDAFHAPLEAVRHLRETHQITPGTIEKIRVGMADGAAQHCVSITRPTDPISAQSSLAFSIGLYLVTGRTTPSDYFDSARWTDPDILAIADLVEPYSMPNAHNDTNSGVTTKLDIALTDGSLRSHHQVGFRGHPSQPAIAAEIEAKFWENTIDTLTAERIDTLLTALRNLDQHDTVGAITDLLGNRHRAGR
ncbi:MmgE/PrpD family protein [Kibdelosporangium aridum]|uniref:MmgE/PrpD family protein n=1 Tax=Kibdelosporangium aridum TaxID=2030 RepID=UPI0035E50587